MQFVIVYWINLKFKLSTDKKHKVPTSIVKKDINNKIFIHCHPKNSNSAHTLKYDNCVNPISIKMRIYNDKKFIRLHDLNTLSGDKYLYHIINLPSIFLCIDFRFFFYSLCFLALSEMNNEIKKNPAVNYASDDVAGLLS